jgi:hypothetical protein
MHTKFFSLALAYVLSSLLFVSAVNADTLTLTDGQVIKGKYVIKDDKEVTFEVAGQQLKIPLASVASLDMDFATPAPAETSAPAEPAAAAAPVKKIVPAGTRVVARTSEAIDSKKHKEGHKFTARLEADMVVDEVVVAPRGSTLYGVLSSAKSSRRLAGSSEMVLTFTDILINNQMYPIATSSLKAVTENTAKKTAGTTARAAAIGGLVGGSDDAKRGAKIGLGLSVLSSGNQINIPRDSLLEFQLATPFSP